MNIQYIIKKMIVDFIDALKIIRGILSDKM